MRTVVHLSDLHFGKEEPLLVTAIRQEILELSPDLVTVSGDFTQRARVSQFEKARQFLASLPFQQLVIPGNHDIAPWHRPVARMTNGLGDFGRYITKDETPFYGDSEIAVAGINSARIFSRKGGRINLAQVERCCELFGNASAHAVRILVSHHPFDLPPGHSAGDLIGRAHVAMEKLAECKVDVFCAGHLHVSNVCDTARRYGISGHSAISVQAGTAISRRLREQYNSWNVLRIQRPRIVVDRYQWDENVGRFAVGSSEEFRHTEAGWARTQPDPNDADTFCSNSPVPR